MHIYIRTRHARATFVFTNLEEGSNLGDLVGACRVLWARVGLKPDPCARREAANAIGDAPRGYSQFSVRHDTQPRRDGSRLLYPSRTLSLSLSLT